MVAIGRLQLKEKEKPSEAKKKLDLLYSIFNSCLNGSGYVDEALEAAEMLAEFLGSEEVKAVPGISELRWENDLAQFFIRQGLVHQAREAAKLRNRPLTTAELNSLNQALRRKKAVMAAFDNLASYFCEEGSLDQAYLAARLAGRSLTTDEIERIKGSHILMSYRNEDRAFQRR